MENGTAEERYETRISLDQMAEDENFDVKDLETNVEDFLIEKEDRKEFMKKLEKIMVQCQNI